VGDDGSGGAKKMGRVVRRQIGSDGRVRVVEFRDLLGLVW
jgi:hypothetical protein